MVSWAALTLQILHLRPGRGSEAAEGGSALPLCLQHRAGTKRARRTCCVCRYIVRVCDVGCGTEAMLLGLGDTREIKALALLAAHTQLWGQAHWEAALCQNAEHLLPCWGGEGELQAMLIHPCSCVWPPSEMAARNSAGVCTAQASTTALLTSLIPRRPCGQGWAWKQVISFWYYLLDTLGTVHSVITDPDSTRRGANTTLQVKKLKHRAPYNFHVTQVHVGAATGI